MREYQKGDVVRLKVHMPADTVRGVKRMEAGWEFEVISVMDGTVKAWDRNGVKTFLPAYAVEFVRAGHNPPDDGPPAPAGGKRASKLPARRGLIKTPEAA